MPQLTFDCDYVTVRAAGVVLRMTRDQFERACQAGKAWQRHQRMVRDEERRRQESERRDAAQLIWIKYDR